MCVGNGHRAAVDERVGQLRLRVSEQLDGPDLEVAARRQEHVRGLEVGVQHAVLGERVHGHRELARPAQELLGLEPPALDPGEPSGGGRREEEGEDAIARNWERRVGLVLANLKTYARRRAQPSTIGLCMLELCG